MIGYSQDYLLVSDFEDGVVWNSWGAPIDVVENPAPGGINVSDSVLLLDQTDNAWSGAANWNDTPILTADYVKLSVDVYMVDLAGEIKLHMDNPVESGAANFEGFVAVANANEWARIEFDLTDIEATDYKQIAFQSGVATPIYFDNVYLLIDGASVPGSGGEEPGGTSVSQSSVQLANVFPNPATDVLNIENIENIIQVNVYDVTGAIVMTDFSDILDISKLNQGMYVVKIKTTEDLYTASFLKK